MKIKIMTDDFGSEESLEMVTRMIHSGISFHQQKIRGTRSAKEIHLRQAYIRNLERSLYEICRQAELKNAGHLQHGIEIELHSPGVTTGGN